MKRTILMAAIAWCSMALCGCPYESHVPIDDPNVPIQEGLLGKWKTDAESYSEFFISKANSNQYAVEQKTTTGERKKYLAHISQVKGVSFLNLWSDSTKAYYLYRIRMDASNAKMVLVPFSESLSEHFASSGSLRTYVEKNMNMQRLYNDSDKEEFAKVQ